MPKGKEAVRDWKPHPAGVGCARGVLLGLLFWLIVWQLWKFL